MCETLTKIYKKREAHYFLMGIKYFLPKCGIQTSSISNFIC